MESGEREHEASEEQVQKIEEKRELIREVLQANLLEFARRMRQLVPEGAVKRVTWLDNGEPLEFRQDGPRLTLQATGFPPGTNTVVRSARVEG